MIMRNIKIFGKPKQPLVTLALSLIVLTFFTNSCSKDTIRPEVKESFVQLFGGASGNEGYDVLRLDDGSYVILGTTVVPNSKSNIYLAGIDQYGKKLWKTTFGGDFVVYAYSMEVLSDGRIAIIGSHQTSGLSNVFLVITEPKENGARDSISISDDQNKFNLTGYRVKELKNKDLIIVGSASNLSDGTKGLIMYVKPDLKAKTTILRNYFEYGNFTIKDVVENEFGCIVAGYETNLQLSSHSNKGAEDLAIGMFFSTNPTDNMQPLYDFGTTGADKGIRLLKIDVNKYVCLSTTSSTNTGKDIMVTFFSYSDNPNKVENLKNIIYQNPGDDEASDIVATDKGYLITGTSTLGGSSDVFFLSIDKEGAKMGGPKIFGGNGSQRTNAIIATPDGGCVIIGGTGTANTTSSKIIVYKLDKNGNY
jgi:hypothetical protein